MGTTYLWNKKWSKTVKMNCKSLLLKKRKLLKQKLMKIKSKKKFMMKKSKIKNKIITNYFTLICAQIMNEHTKLL